MNRLTPCEAGAITHRPATLLLPARRCSAGHVAPAYVSSKYCAACAKLSSLRGRPPRPRRSGFRRWRFYADARAEHVERGGWLLILGDVFGTTDRPGTVARLRGWAWVERCESVGAWDEVELAAADRRR